MSTLGAAIEMARRAGGWTQGEIAERAGVTQATLSRWEHDLRTPSEEDLQAIAAAVGVTPDILLRGRDIEGALGVDVHMRKSKSAPPTKWRMLEARLNLHRLRAGKLLEQVQMQARNTVPTFDPFETAPDDAARMVRMQWRMPAGPVRQLMGWMESAGCVVVEEDFGTRRVEGLSQWIAGHPVALINNTAPTDRKRLTLAHELGHLCLHRNEPTDDIERDAFAFAAEFLMPAQVIRTQLRNPELGRLLHLKREWGVSVQALIERAVNLGTITAQRRSALYRQISALGWKTTEPGSEDIAVEHPTLAASIGDAMRASGLTTQDIAAMVGYATADDLGPYTGTQHHGLRVIGRSSTR